MNRFRDPKFLLALFVLGMTAIAGLVFLACFDPASSSLYPPCPFHALTGLHCPGCGTLRGLHALVHGNLARALSMNPLMVMSILFILFLFVRNIWCAWRRAGLGARPLHPGVSWGVLVVVIAYWALRNVPSYPFTLLAPG